MKIGKSRIVIGAAILVVVALVAVLLFTGASYRIPEGALKSVYTADPLPVYTGGAIPGDALTAVGENDRLALYYDPASVSVQMRDKRNGFVWSSAFDPAAYPNGADEDLARNLSAICQIVYTDEEYITGIMRTHDVGVETRAEKLENGVSMTFSFPEVSLGMTLELWLDDGGLNARIPRDKLIETGDYRFVSAELMPYLGAAVNTEEGYMVYPDGCGAIYRYKDSKSDIPTLIQQNVYSPALLDYQEVISKAEQGHKNIALPAFGVVKGKNALVGYITVGDDNAYIQLQPSGYGYLVNRLNAGITYRKTYKYQTPDGSEEFAIEDDCRTGDLIVKYFCLQGEEADYSGMASAVRAYLKGSGRLTPSSLLSAKTVPAYTELLVSANEQTMLWENQVVMTDFDAARDILTDLNTENVTPVVSLLGWQKEGYGRYPAHSVSGRAGGSGGLAALRRFADENGIHLLLSENMTRGFADVGGFAKNKESVYSVDGLPVTDPLGGEYFLNAYVQLTKLTEELLPKYQKWASGLALEESGRYVYDDYNQNRDMTRADTMFAGKAMAQAVREQLGISAVQNGNAYMLSSTDFLFNLADAASADPQLDESIPFYQQVVHGSIPYCSHIAANMSHDERAQQLRWAEYGSVPYYLLTEEDPVALKDSYVNTVFSSRYSELKEEIHRSLAEYSRKMDGLWNQEIRRHVSLDVLLKKVIYADGTRVYINYDTVSREADGVTIAPRDYTVCLPDGTQR